MIQYRISLTVIDIDGTMKNFVHKRLFLGFICLHILYHASQKPFYGKWMIGELSTHGYQVSPGTLYPILHSLEKEKLIAHFQSTVRGKVRKYYTITRRGQTALEESKQYVRELAQEVGFGSGGAHDV